MKPDVPKVARELAERLRTDIAAELTGFRANDAAMGAQMLDMIAERWDGAAADLVEENRNFRALLKRGAEIFGDSEFADAANGQDVDLRISSLTATNEHLRAAIIRLHARVEASDSDGAKPLDDAIWAELKRTVEARRVGSANF